MIVWLFALNISARNYTDETKFRRLFNGIRAFLVILTNANISQYLGIVFKNLY
jgi:hypothetical protein